ncbi:MAG: hypothetical protein IAE91_01440 [Ignavibacteriaceae bacterium]|nr:hypothetical protein [Ignavibacteriaceae bacterium]
MNRYNKEEQEFLSLFNRENAIADPLFKARLKTKMLNELEPKKGLFGIFSSSGFSFLAVIAFSFFTVASGFFIVSELSKNPTVKSTPVVSDQKKQEVVEKVTEKTSVTALKLLNVNEFLGTESIVKPEKPADESYNLKTTEVVYKPENPSIICDGLNLPKELTKTQLFEYFGDKNITSKLTKNSETIALVEFVEADEVLSYPTSYAPASYPGSLVESGLIDLKSNFEVIENSEINSTTFTISDVTEFECNDAPTSFPVSFSINRNMVIREFVLNSDYTINRVNLYINEAKSENKIAEITIESETSKISEEEAQDILSDDLL